MKNIHQQVLAAASAPGGLDMARWHTCDTTHCRAGWVEYLAGEAGIMLAWHTTTLFAAMQIYHASSPSINVAPGRFFSNKADAMADMRRCAAEEIAQAI